MTPLWNKLRPWILGVLGLAALAFAYWFDGQPQGWQSLTRSALPGPKAPEGYEIPLTSSLGAPTALSTFKGQWLVVSFGFVSCPDICPVHMGYMAKELRSMATASKSPFGDGKPVKGIFISVDPQRDNLASLEAFRQIFDQNQNILTALTGTEEQLQKVAKSYGAFFEYQKKPETDSVHTGDNDRYDVHHSTGFYIIDPQGQLSTVVSMPAAQGALKQKLDRLM